jgi:RecB family endonuclease NucS
MEHNGAAGPADAGEVREVEEVIDPPPEPGIAFRLEHDMQRALRAELDKLEPGLVEADGGREYRVSTGEIDILARDATGAFVVIELKAGRCPAGALEQVLGYAQALREERDDAGSVRIFLIAAEFSDRIRAAARMIPGVMLRSYRFSLRFQDVV